MLGSCTAKPIHSVGSSSIVVLHTVQLRPPKMGTTNEYSARNTAPEIPGSAASQNSWLVVNLKPMCGNSTTITLHTTQTANASSSAGIDTSRLRVAMRRPVAAQKASSSGRQSTSTWRRGRVRSMSPAPASASRVAACPARMPSRSFLSATHIQIMVTMITRVISMKQLLRTPMTSAATPNMIGSVNPPRPPMTPTMPPTTPIWVG